MIHGIAVILIQAVDKEAEPVVGEGGVPTEDFEGIQNMMMAE
jgi:hypothetical protein